MTEEEFKEGFKELAEIYGLKDPTVYITVSEYDYGNDIGIGVGIRADGNRYYRVGTRTGTSEYYAALNKSYHGLLRAFENCLVGGASDHAAYGC